MSVTFIPSRTEKFTSSKIGLLAPNSNETSLKLIICSARGIRRKTSTKYDLCQIKAERVRFELTVPFGTTVFKTIALNHSATSPYCTHIIVQQPNIDNSDYFMHE